jgi:hypothetical protein
MAKAKPEVPVDRCDSRRVNPRAYNAGREAFLKHGEAGEGDCPRGPNRVHWLVGFLDVRTAARVACIEDPGEAPLDECA